MFNLKFPKESN